MLSSAYLYLADFGIHVANFLGLGFIETAGLVFTGILPVYLFIVLGIGCYRRYAAVNRATSDTLQTSMFKLVNSLLVTNLGRPVEIRSGKFYWEITSGYGVILCKKHQGKAELWVPYSEDIVQSPNLIFDVYEREQIRPEYTYYCAGLEKLQKGVLITVSSEAELKSLDKYLFDY
ncbi:hypothetical protein VIN01S_22220 [Vibrio inusitatus NBRC 102082]|uniref:Uncharacterized protein n=1 Tax=Vibrio inusitatus NBRC 102082 TaxID=1219070 RepID=A0A4Y3HWM1_9VIBR|nr:hypothetical protein [Vibrio inusitatus]GEA51418.1 hypothetical protein VIN01S_22220 [Vibrio inusitatus NBRC 102082]